MTYWFYRAVAFLVRLLPLPHQPTNCGDKQNGNNNDANGFPHYAPPCAI